MRFSKNAKPWIKDLKVRETARDGKDYLIKISDCACSDGGKVERRYEGDAEVIIAIESMTGIAS